MTSPKSEIVAYARDLDGSGSLHMCAADDEGTIALCVYEPFSRDMELALGDAITALEEMARWEDNKAHSSELFGEVMEAESCKRAAESLRKSAQLLYTLTEDYASDSAPQKLETTL